MHSAVRRCVHSAVVVAALKPAVLLLDWAENAAVLTYAFEEACRELPRARGKLDVDTVTMQFTASKIMAEVKMFRSRQS